MPHHTPIVLTDALRQEYQHLWDTCTVPGDVAKIVAPITRHLISNTTRYTDVAAQCGIPWPVVAVLHQMEAGQDFTRHLHNGDPLTARTVHVPAGRPDAGTPPFSWEDSALDALCLHKGDQWHDWGVPGMLFWIEGYNGWGYRSFHAQVLSPYLWAGSRHYICGKYLSDGQWSTTAISRQIGAAVLLRKLLGFGDA